MQASIIGKKYGTRRWPRTKKTVEGTIAFAVAVILGALVVVEILPRLPYFTCDLQIDWGTFIVSTILTGLSRFRNELIISTARSNVVTKRQFGRSSLHVDTLTIMEC